LLEDIPLGGTLGTFGANNPPVVYTSSAHTLLAHGQTYWLLPFASGDTSAVWNANDQGQTGTKALSTEAEPTSWALTNGEALPAFEVSGSPAGVSLVPEPSSLALLGLGALALVGVARRRRAGPESPVSPPALRQS